MAKNRVIGKNNALPWRLQADLKHFKSITLNKPVVMGRHTYESIGKPLLGRTNIIISRDQNYTLPHCIVVHSIEEALNVVKSAEEVMIIGGAMIYELFLPIAHRLYLTLVDAEIEGDAYFPTFNERNWQETSCAFHPPDENNTYGYSFIVLDRVK